MTRGDVLVMTRAHPLFDVGAVAVMGAVVRLVLRTPFEVEADLIDDDGCRGD